MRILPFWNFNECTRTTKNENHVANEKSVNRDWLLSICCGSKRERCVPNAFNVPPNSLNEKL